MELKPSTYIATNITSQESKSSKEMKLFPSSATNIISKLPKNSRGAEPSTFNATNIKVKRKRTKSKKAAEKSVKKLDTSPLVAKGATSRKQLFPLVPLKKENYKSHISSVFNLLQTTPMLWKLVLLSLETDNDKFTIACHHKPTALASSMLGCAMKVESIESMKKSNESKCVKINTFDNARISYEKSLSFIFNNSMYSEKQIRVSDFDLL